MRSRSFLTAAGCEDRVADPDVGQALTFRPATRSDLPRLVEMLADDPLGATRERPGPPLPPAYLLAFDAITADDDNELIVACLGATVVGVLQLTFIPSLTYQGRWRAHIEGVRIAARHRSRGVGRRLIEWAVERSRARDCVMVQLTTTKSRREALRFYELLGFEASHEGLKLHLEP
jgi:ribosomal protein S18 acetylase RimI-like enzyme